MNEEILYRIPGSILFVILFVLLIGVTTAGYLYGKRRHSLINDAVRAQITTLQSSLLGLLALLLGFTFAMTVSRYDTRKQLVLDEANAVGTTYLRAKLLSEPYASQALSLLTEYVTIRIEFYKAGNDDSKLREVNEKSEKLHSQLWSVARTAASANTRSVATGLFIQSLNDVIDLHAKRLIALDNHVPEPIILLLWFVSFLSLGLTGYTCGLAGWRHFMLTTMMALLIAAVIYLIMDLDRPRSGLIQVSQKSMIQLHESMMKNRQ